MMPPSASHGRNWERRRRLICVMVNSSNLGQRYASPRTHDYRRRLLIPEGRGKETNRGNRWMSVVGFFYVSPVAARWRLDEFCMQIPCPVAELVWQFLVYSPQAALQPGMKADAQKKTAKPRPSSSQRSF